jgi:hypothetical protein
MGSHDAPSIRSSALARIVDNGRIVLTACDHTQEAIEDPVAGHGMLTRHLLDALRGPAELVEHGRIGIYDLLAYVTRRVSEDAAGMIHAPHSAARSMVSSNCRCSFQAQSARGASLTRLRRRSPVSFQT